MLSRLFARFCLLSHELGLHLRLELRPLREPFRLATLREVLLLLRHIRYHQLTCRVRILRGCTTHLHALLLLCLSKELLAHVECAAALAHVFGRC